MPANLIPYRAFRYYPKPCLQLESKIKSASRVQNKTYKIYAAPLWPGLVTLFQIGMAKRKRNRACEKYPNPGSGMQFGRKPANPIQNWASNPIPNKTCKPYLKPPILRFLFKTALQAHPNTSMQIWVQTKLVVFVEQAFHNPSNTKPADPIHHQACKSYPKSNLRKSSKSKSWNCMQNQ